MKILKTLISLMLALPTMVLAILTLCHVISFTPLAIVALVDNGLGVVLLVIVGIGAVIKNELNKE